MKTINELVAGLSNEERDSAAKGYFIKRIYDLMEEIVEINNDYESYQSGRADVRGRDFAYEEIKKELEETFNPEYERLHQDAIRGKLRLAEINEVMERIRKETFG